ncbi:MAG: aminomethyl-transferring glycine dehydrogenase subunit GcvPA [Eubacteriales bacterium]|nr:aminomethyl-transferring glycine dehydrogenase subunit GcvPA [Eubacteriales bacterium]MDD4717209.1 aminomethyl-transferring glycine dehydrogenase subunit GcvPA [Eubacteriales bacterium]
MGNYIPVTDAERERMKKTVGIADVSEFFAGIPEEVLLEGSLNIPEGVSELDVLRKFADISRKNVVFRSVFRGAGIYDRYIPAIVEYVTAKEEFVTAYTPYQPEISQGVLQSIFEYQTMICELTGMDVSNASVYDGATAAAEAVAMCRERNRNTVVLSEGLHPQVLEVIETYCFGSGMKIVKVPLKHGRTDTGLLSHMLDETVACVMIAQPNFLGQIEDAGVIGDMVHDAKVKFVMNCDPFSLAVLKTPAGYGADIAVGDGQSIGPAMSFGGPTFGYMACTSAMMRKLPGRIAGETVDTEGKRTFVLTLQAREQHIRREKASSNICSNQALCAMTAAVYLSSVGPEGLKTAALSSISKAHYLKNKINGLKGFESPECGEFFNEFVTHSPVEPHLLCDRLAKRGILGGLPLKGELEGYILWCTTEKNTREHMDELVEVLREVCGL